MTKFPWKIYTRPILLQIVIITTVISVAGAIAHTSLKKRFTEHLENQLRDVATLLAVDPLPEQAHTYCRDRVKSTNLRLSIIALSGHVLCDSHQEAFLMDNHSNRPEVTAALKFGSGRSVRYSETIKADLMYVAMMAEDHSYIVRVALPLTYLEHALDLLEDVLWGALITVIIVLSFFAMWTGRRLLNPLAQILHKAQVIVRHASTWQPTVKAVLPATELQTTQDDPDEFLTSMVGEWAQLEISLDTIQKNLSEKNADFAFERQEQTAIMSAISEAIVAVDLHESVLFFNSRFAIIFGRSILERDKTLTEIFREPKILDMFRGVLKSGQIAQLGAYALSSTDSRFFSIVISPLKDQTGSTYGAVGVFHDVTELKRAEQIRIDFVANVSHELRTPLTAIKGYTETLAGDMKQHNGDIPQLWHDFIQVIMRNSDRLMSLINDLLDLSSIEASDKIIKTAIDTKELTERVIEKLHSTIQDKQHEISTVFDVPVVLGDLLRVEQVLTNLLDNACKYTPTGGKIAVSWEYEQMGRIVALRVSDNGPGIPTEHHDRLFERFYRVDKGRSREMGGTGLGLSIVKHIMQQHGGNVRVQSASRVGTTFICTFPDN